MHYVIDRENIVFSTGDDVPLSGTLFLPARPEAPVLVCAATGTRQQF
jgi:hypothetical protein